MGTNITTIGITIINVALLIAIIIGIYKEDINMFDINKLNINDDLWSEIDNKKDCFKKELHKELNRKHILYGIEVKEIARREDCDDVLFLILDGSNRYAVVHLTWTSKKEKDSYYPRTRIYNNLNNLINEEGC